MPNYQEGKIYKIYNTVNDEIYIGSTIRKLSERMAEHRRRINGRYLQFPIYKAFREHGVENLYIELVEKCPCNDKDELRKKEGEYIRELKPSLNIRIAGRTKNEYDDDNREHKTEYYQNNKEYITQQHKQYRENNKEDIKEQKKQYYDINKERITQHKAEKIKCECGCVITRGCLWRHRQSKKHIELMKDKLN